MYQEMRFQHQFFMEFFLSASAHRASVAVCRLVARRRGRAAHRDGRGRDRRALPAAARALAQPRVRGVRAAQLVAVLAAGACAWRD